MGLDIRLRSDPALRQCLAERRQSLAIQTGTLEEHVTLLVVRDLLSLGWEADFRPEAVKISPPTEYTKETIRTSMDAKRHEAILSNSAWISKHIDLARNNLADGEAAWKSDVDPVLEVVENDEQADLFRILRYYWSSPYSEYVGRRIKLIIRNNALPNRPVIGIAALGSSIVHIPERDDWIGWDIETRTRNLVYAMDAYVLGALPPYNHMLGGKLISSIIASNEIRDIFSKKYRDQVTKISKRKANRLACIFTTSLFGRSSQYNRLVFRDAPLYIPIGYTRGYGTLHLTNETFLAMRQLVRAHGLKITNKFGDGPVWRMRVIRSAASLLGLDADFLLRHSFRRQIYAIPHAENARQFLRGEHKKLTYSDRPLAALIDHWKSRWFLRRKERPETRSDVLGFRVSHFNVD